MPNIRCSGIVNDRNACTLKKKNVTKFHHKVQSCAANYFVQLFENSINPRSQSNSMRSLTLSPSHTHKLSKRPFIVDHLIRMCDSASVPLEFRAQMCHSPLLIMQLKSYRLLSMRHYHGLAAVCRNKNRNFAQVTIAFRLVQVEFSIFTRLANRLNWSHFYRHQHIHSVLGFFFVCVCAYQYQHIAISISWYHGIG